MVAQEVHSARIITGLHYQGKEDMKHREAFDLNRITAGAMRAEINRSFKRIARSLHDRPIKEIALHRLYVFITLDNELECRLLFNLRIEQRKNVFYLQALSDSDTLTIVGQFPISFQPDILITLAQWETKSAAAETAVAETQIEEGTNMNQNDIMMKAVVDAGQGHLLNTMEVTEAYQIVMSLGNAQAATASEAEQTTEEATPMVEESVPMMKVKELLAQQETMILLRMASILEAKQQAEVKTAEVEVAAPQAEVASGLAEKMTAMAKAKGKASSFMTTRIITASAIEVSTKVTAGGIRLMTDLTAAAITITGHGLANVIEGGGKWAGAAIRPKEEEASDVTPVSQVLLV